MQGQPAWRAHAGGIEPAERPTRDRKVAGSRPGCGTVGVGGHGLEGPSCDKYGMQATSCEQQVSRGEKNLGILLDLCVSSLRRGHANLLCIIPILTDDPRRESKNSSSASGPYCITAPCMGSKRNRYCGTVCSFGEQSISLVSHTLHSNMFHDPRK